MNGKRHTALLLAAGVASAGVLMLRPHGMLPLLPAMLGTLLFAGAWTVVISQMGLTPEAIVSLWLGMLIGLIFTITISQVMGCGRQKGYTEIYRGTHIDINVLPKIKVEIAVEDRKVEPVIEAIIGAARLGEIGDGKIFVSEIVDVIRIRTGERGSAAL